MHFHQACAASRINDAFRAEIRVQIATQTAKAAVPVRAVSKDV